MAIIAGMWWSYEVLGWGGYWAWDPVENASFMPWLMGTALVHSLAVTEKRGAFKSWTVLLAIGAFSLSLLGAFIVRSGVLTSVHAFAVDRARALHSRLARDLLRRASALRVARASKPRAVSLVARGFLAREQYSPGHRSDGCCSARSIRYSSTRSVWARSRLDRRISTR
jgi:hypothetical protein